MTPKSSDPAPSQGGGPALNIGQLAAMAAVSTNAVRYYEREGLMQAAPKAGNGYRQYDGAALKRLRFIKQAQQSGFTLAEVQSLLLLDNAKTSCCNDVRSKVIEKKLALEARIKLMQAMSLSLDRLLADCINDARPTGDCTILAALGGLAVVEQVVEAAGTGTAASHVQR